MNDSAKPNTDNIVSQDTELKAALCPPCAAPLCGSTWLELTLGSGSALPASPCPPTSPWLCGTFALCSCWPGNLSSSSFEDNLKIDEQSMETSSSFSEQFSAQSGKMSLSLNTVLSRGAPAFRTANDFYKVKSRISCPGVHHLELQNKTAFLKRQHCSSTQRIPDKFGFEGTSLCAVLSI